LPGLTVNPSESPDSLERGSFIMSEFIISGIQECSFGTLEETAKKIIPKKKSLKDRLPTTGYEDWYEQSHRYRQIYQGIIIIEGVNRDASSVPLH
jgi:hypothetical protein